MDHPRRGGPLPGRGGPPRQIVQCESSTHTAHPLHPAPGGGRRCNSPRRGRGRRKGVTARGGKRQGVMPGRGGKEKAGDDSLSFGSPPGNGEIVDKVGSTLRSVLSKGSLSRGCSNSPTRSDTRLLGGGIESAKASPQMKRPFVVERQDDVDFLGHTFSARRLNSLQVWEFSPPSLFSCVTPLRQEQMGLPLCPLIVTDSQ